MTAAPHQTLAFSLVEVMVIVAIIGVTATIAIPLVTGVPDASKKAKLEQDVAIVNNAIDSYLAAGGNPENLTPSGILPALKSRVYGGMPAEMLGPQGPFLDPAVITNRTDFAWSALFTTEPRPRFYVVQNTNGVIFGQGPAMAVGGVAERPDEARPSWLWAYAEATPPSDMETFTPVAVDNTAPAANIPLPGITLGPPLISPGSRTDYLWGFPLPVTLINPNPQRSSRIYYKVGSGNFSLYEDGSALMIGPGSSLVAVCVSLDPSRYYNSTTASNFYGVIPLELSVKITAPTAVTYAQAGGLIQGVSQLQPVNATITLEQTADGATDNLLVKEGENDKYIPPAYLKDANFTVRYTTDGSDPITDGIAAPSFSGFFSPVNVPLGLAVWGTNSSVVIRAVAIAANTSLFVSSATEEAAATISPTALPQTIFPANPIGLPYLVQINESAPVPVGLRKLYTTDGNQPLTAATGGFVRSEALTYSSPMPSTALPATSYTLTAQATGPAGFEQWFSSPPASRRYTTITVLNPDFVGANISGGDVNGSFRGSIFVAAPANLGIFNAGGQVVNGNLYLPGLPGIEIPGSGNSSKTVVAPGARFVDSPGLIPRTLIAGKDITAEGILADPQLDTRQIVDLSGSGVPTNYTVKLTKSSFIEGKIYRNVDVPPPPPSPFLPQSLTVVTNNFTGIPATTLAPGIYSNRITMSSSSSVLRLGVAGASSPAQYIFTGNTFAKGNVEILGPVEIYFTDGWVNSGVVFGNANTINQLRVNVMSGDIDLKSGGTLYGDIWASGTLSIGNGGILFGNIFAQTLNVAPGGIVNTEPQL